MHLRPPELVRFAASNYLNTAERDLLRLLRDLGMQVPMTIDNFVSRGQRFAYIKLSTWFRYLLNVRNGGQLIGGFGPADHHGHLCLRAFWDAFAKENPGHAVLELHSEHLHRVIPYALHLDEGRGLRKSAVLAVHAQSVFGASTAPCFMQKLGRRGADGLSDQEKIQMMQASQQHNGKGSTYLSRMLLTLLPKEQYTKRNAHVYTTLLQTVCDEATSLLEDGVLVGGAGLKYFFAMVACKGDAPALAKAGGFCRSFLNLGNPMCHECLAGSPGVPFEDCRPSPTYERTIYRTRPWMAPTPLGMIPGNPQAPESLFTRDPFHVYKQSIGGAFVASSIVLLGELGYFNSGDQNNFDTIMERMFQDFVFYIKRELRCGNNHVKHFTRTNLHFPRAQSFPYMRIKGSDIMLLTRWLRHLVLHGANSAEGRTRSMIDNPLENWQKPILEAISRAAAGAIRFFHILHTNGLWLDRGLGRHQGESALQFAAQYSFLASQCHGRGLHRFSLVPSLHYMHHFWIDAKRKLANESALLLSSPALANCEGDEDFIGKVSRISRHVHPSVTNRRTLDRYLVKLHFVFAEEDG